MFFDHHVHMEHGPFDPHSYPKEWIESFFHTAINRNVSGVGIVEHAYRFKEASGLLPGTWSEQRCHFHLDSYLAGWNSLQDRLPVSLGLEMDYVPETELAIKKFLSQKPWDFVIGSVHFLGNFGLDVKDMASQYDVLGADAVWTLYYRTSIQAVESGLFQIISHPDLPKIWGHPKPDPATLTALYDAFCQALSRHHVALEINTAGLRRPVHEIYPHPELLHIAHDYNVPITFASDAHEPENVGLDFPQAQEFARSCGFTTAMSFHHKEGKPYRFSD